MRRASESVERFAEFILSIFPQSHPARVWRWAAGRDRNSYKCLMETDDLPTAFNSAASRERRAVKDA
jgi:hypothetical protein